MNYPNFVYLVVQEEWCEEIKILAVFYDEQQAEKFALDYAAKYYQNPDEVSIYVKEKQATLPDQNINLVLLA